MKNATWDDCVAFHGHSCGGLTIGYKAALYAIELLELKFSDDEEVCCICENDACGVDAIQVMLGCRARGRGTSCSTSPASRLSAFMSARAAKAFALCSGPDRNI